MVLYDDSLWGWQDAAIAQLVRLDSASLLAERAVSKAIRRLIDEDDRFFGEFVRYRWMHGEMLNLRNDNFGLDFPHPSDRDLMHKSKWSALKKDIFRFLFVFNVFHKKSPGQERFGCNGRAAKQIGQVSQAALTWIFNKDYVNARYKLETLYYSAIFRGYTVLVDQIVHDSRFVAKELARWGVNLAARCGFLDIVKMMFSLAYPADKELEINIPATIDYAIHDNYTDIVIFLLSDSRLNNETVTRAFYSALRAGNLDIAIMLLKDSRFDLLSKKHSHFECTPLYFAIRYSVLEIVRLLLADPRIDPAEYDNGAIFEAARCKSDPAIVDALLCDNRVDPNARDMAALEMACCRGNVDTVCMLLKRTSVNPHRRIALLTHAVLYSPSSTAHLIVNVLLHDPIIANAITRLQIEEIIKRAVEELENEEYAEVINVLTCFYRARFRMRKQRRL